MAILPITPGQLPSGACPSTYQEILNLFSAHQSVNVSAADGLGVVVSSAKPTDETLPWLRLDASGKPERLYWFASGAWISRHPLVTGLTQWYFDVMAPNPTTFLESFDGGTNAAISDISGPMWQLAKNSGGAVIAAQFPIATGTLPSGLVLAQGDTGGEEKHVLTEPELPILELYPDPFAGTQFPAGGGAISGGGADVAQIKPFPTQTDVGGGLGHQNMPPYVVGYLIQRTARQFYAVP